MIPVLGYAVHDDHSPLVPFSFERREPGSHDIQIEILYAGICHSDVHQAHNDCSNSKYPMVPGHEIVGRVVKCGPNAIGVKAGDIRIVYPWLGCGTCATCLGEDDNMCTVAARSLGVYQNGGYGTHVIAPHPRHLVDPGTLDLALAAMLTRSECLILTGGHDPSPYILDRAASERETTLLLAPGGTVERSSA